MRPDSRIISVTRSNVALLTRDVETAIEQSKVYVAELGRRLRHAERHMLCLGNEAYIFIIMGLHEEISEKLGEKLFREQIEEKLPRNVRLLPYDTVFHGFSSTVPASVMILVPQVPVTDQNLDRVVQEMSEEERHYWDAEMCG